METSSRANRADRALRTFAPAALAGAVAAGCVVLPEAETYEEASRAELALEPQTRVVVENPRGSVNLFASQGGDVELDARKTILARTREQGRTIASDIRVDVVRDGDALRLVVDYPSRLQDNRVTIEFFGFRSRVRRASVDLDLSLPSGTPVEIVTRSGDVHAEDYAGALHIDTASGDLYLRGHEGDVVYESRSGDMRAGIVNGSLTVRTVSGDLVARRVLGSLRFDATSGDAEVGEVGGDVVIDTGSGDAELDVVGGSLEIRTTSGDVEARRVGGDVIATAASGDVTVALARPSRGIFVRTSSGDVRLTLAKPLSGRLDVSTASGDVRADLEMALEEYGRRGLRAVLGPGEGSIEVRTASGDVHLSALEPR